MLTDVQQRLVVLSRNTLDNYNGHRILSSADCGANS